MTAYPDADGLAEALLQRRPGLIRLFDLDSYTIIHARPPPVRYSQFVSRSEDGLSVRNFVGNDFLADSLIVARTSCIIIVDEYGDCMKEARRFLERGHVENEEHVFTCSRSILFRSPSLRSVYVR